MEVFASLTPEVVFADSDISWFSKVSGNVSAKSIQFILITLYNAFVQLNIVHQIW